jgi:hypothetical protein
VFHNDIAIIATECGKNETTLESCLLTCWVYAFYMLQPSYNLSRYINFLGIWTSIASPGHLMLVSSIPKACLRRNLEIHQDC